MDNKINDIRLVVTGVNGDGKSVFIDDRSRLVQPQPFRAMAGIGYGAGMKRLRLPTMVLNRMDCLISLRQAVFDLLPSPSRREL